MKQNDSGFERIDDGRLEEEQPGTIWAPRSGERVARDIYDSFDSTLPDSLTTDDTHKACHTEIKVIGLIDQQFDPSASLQRNLENCVGYLSSEQFLRDLARGHV